VIVGTNLPGPNSIDHVNAKTLEVIYHLMGDKSINFSHYILGYMLKASTAQCRAPLPNANFLTLNFHQFGVCLTNEIHETKPVLTISNQSLKYIQFFRTKSGLWKFVDEMTPDEKASVPKPCQPQPIPPTKSPTPTLSPFGFGLLLHTQ